MPGCSLPGVGPGGGAEVRGAECAEPTLEFVVVNPQGSTDPLAVRVELGASANDTSDGARAAVADRISAGVKASIGVAAVVEVLDRETLERSGYKLRRVVDE